MGLPGSGKTSLARELARLLEAVHFNADEVRANLNYPFSSSNGSLKISRYLTQRK